MLVRAEARDAGRTGTPQWAIVDDVEPRIRAPARRARSRRRPDRYGGLRRRRHRQPTRVPGPLAGGAVAVAGGRWPGAPSGRIDPVAEAPTTTTSTAPPQLRSRRTPCPAPDPRSAAGQRQRRDPQVVIGTIALPQHRRDRRHPGRRHAHGHQPAPGALAQHGHARRAGQRGDRRPSHDLQQALQPAQRPPARRRGHDDHEQRAVRLPGAGRGDRPGRGGRHRHRDLRPHRHPVRLPPSRLGRQRIVAKLRLLDGSGRPVDSDAALPPLDEGSQETGHSLVVRSGTDPLADTGT